MVRRPLCILCLLVMTGLFLLDLLSGGELVRGNPLPDQVQKWMEEQSEVTVCGVVQKCVDTEFSQSVWLKDACLICSSGRSGQEERISIKNTVVYLKEETRLPAGTTVYVSGTPQRPETARNPGGFDSRQYYACRHVYYLLKKAVVLKKSRSYSRYEQFILDFQEKCAEILEKTAGEAAPVFSAIVLGDKTGLSPELRMRYQQAGIVHILAISGLHISLLGMGLYSLLKKAGLGIWPAGMLSLTLMLQYGMMTGGSVSTMRAVCMFLLHVGARILVRIYDPMTALAAAALLLLLESPAYLYDSGFLLSFGAVLGVGTAAPALMGLLGIKNNFWKSLLSSVSVQLATLPVSLWAFGEVSLPGLLLNLLVLPSVGVVLASGVAAVLICFFSLQAAGAAILPGRILLAVYEKLCAAVGKIPFCTWIGGQPEAWQVLVYYGILLLTLCAGNFAARIRKEKDHTKSPEEARNSGYTLLGLKSAGCLALAGGILLLGRHPSPYLSITCLDVGQGDGIVIETPAGEHYLVDGGSSSQSSLGQYCLLPYLKSQGISRLQGIFISHTDSDHISGVLELLGFIEKGLTTLRVDCLLLPEWTEPPQAWTELAQAAQRAGVQVCTGNEGDRVLSGETVFSLLTPEAGAAGSDVNEEGMVLEISWGSFTGLLTGDIVEETESVLLEKEVLSDVGFLKVGHHGSRYSSGSAFLEKILPEVSIISCSDTNLYGHPSPETVQRLSQAGSHVEYTMKSGAVTVFTDGVRMWVKRFLD